MKSTDSITKFKIAISSLGKEDPPNSGQTTEFQGFSTFSLTSRHRNRCIILTKQKLRQLTIINVRKRNKKSINRSNCPRGLISRY